MYVSTIFTSVTKYTNVSVQQFSIPLYFVPTSLLDFIHRRPENKITNPPHNYSSRFLHSVKFSFKQLE